MAVQNNNFQVGNKAKSDKQLLAEDSVNLIRLLKETISMQSNDTYDTYIMGPYYELFETTPEKFIPEQVIKMKQELLIDLKDKIRVVVGMEKGSIHNRIQNIEASMRNNSGKKRRRKRGTVATKDLIKEEVERECKRWSSWVIDYMQSDASRLRTVNNSNCPIEIRIKYITLWLKSRIDFKSEAVVVARLWLLTMSTIDGGDKLNEKAVRELEEMTEIIERELDMITTDGIVKDINNTTDNTVTQIIDWNSVSQAMGKTYHAACFIGPNCCNFITGLSTGKLASNLIDSYKETIDSIDSPSNRLVFVIDSGSDDDDTNITLRDLRKRECDNVTKIKPYRPQSYSMLHNNRSNSFFSQGKCPW